MISDKSKLIKMLNETKPVRFKKVVNTEIPLWIFIALTITFLIYISICLGAAHHLFIAGFISAVFITALLIMWIFFFDTRKVYWEKIEND